MPVSSLRCSLPWLTLAAVLLALCAPEAAAQSGKSTANAAASEELPIRLRIEWGGNDPLLWSGVVELSAGELTAPHSLGVEADEPGTLWIDQGSVWIQRRSPRTYDAFEVTVLASPDAILTISLQVADTAQAAERMQVRVAELYEQSRSHTFQNHRGSLVIRRSPGDAIHVQTDRPHLVFEPEEEFTAKATFRLFNLRSPQTAARFEWRLTPARSETVLARNSQPLTLHANAQSALTAPLQFRLPEQEGAYNLHLSLRTSRLELASRSVQLMVVEREAPAPQGSVMPRVIDDFSPETATFERLLGNSSMQKTVTGYRQFAGAMIERDGQLAADSELNWSAYRLRIENMNRPHQLILTLPPGVAQNVGASLLQPNALGHLTPRGLDTGLAVTTDWPVLPANDESSALTQRIYFWPHVSDPVLLLHNVGAKEGPEVSRVQVVEVGEHLPPAADVPRLKGAAARWVGPYLNKPLLVESFGVVDAQDPGSRRSLDDWHSFHSAGQRLVEYIHSEGYNSLLLAVFAEGSTLYPSQLLEPTPRYDNGAFSSLGLDPLRKDVLELLFRLFDREELVLVPELQFSTPLPELERHISQSAPGAVGIELVGRDGRTWRETQASSRGRGPWYNPLDGRVQDAVARVVHELVERYRHHPSFRGVSLQLSTAGYLQLPGLEWGYDDETVRRFELATRIRVPTSKGPDRFALRYEFLTTTASREWVKWRCDEISRFHARLAEIVTSAIPNARVLLNAQQALTADLPGDDILNALKFGTSFGEMLLPRGLDFSRAAETPQIVVLRPVIHAGSDELLDRALNATVNNSPTLDAALCPPGVTPGSLFFSAPRETRVQAFDSISPWQPAYTYLATPVVPAGGENRKRFAHALSTLDSRVVFDGSWTIPFGQEAETRDLRWLIQSLPATRFQTFSPRQQPVTLRIAADAEQSWLYAVNDSHLPAAVHIQLASDATTPLQPLAASEAVPLKPASGGASSLTITLKPYSAWGCRLQDPRAQIVGYTVRLPEAALVDLKRRIDQFEQILTQINEEHDRRPSPLSNGGFELAGQRRRELPGWDFPEGSNKSWTLDHREVHSGRYSLKLAARQQSTAVLTHPLPLENSRYLTASLWVKSDQPALLVRLALEGQVDGQPYVQQANIQAGPQWQQYLFRIRNLPSESLQNARFRIEMLQGGRVWIDDVQVQLQRLTQDDSRQLTKTLSSLRLAWDEKRYADCERMLTSYWGRFLFEDPPATPTVEERQPQLGTRLRNLLR